MTLVSVVLNGHQTQYTDTKALLDFGFQNFQTVSAAEYDTEYPSIENDMTIAGLTTTQLSGLQIDPESRVTIPKSADFSSVTSQISYEMTENDPSDAIARIDYQWGQRKIGKSYLKLKASLSGGQGEDIQMPEPQAIEPHGVEPESAAPGAITGGQSSSDTGQNGSSDSGSSAPQANRSSDSPLSTFHVPTVVWIILAVLASAAVLTGLFLLIKAHLEKKEEEARMLRRQKRLARLQDGGISPAEFDLLMEQKRSSYTTTRSSRRKKRRGSSNRRFRL